jgi:hypothetical protein
MIPILVGLGTAVLNTVKGWLKVSIEDGEIQNYEIKEGIVSIVVTSIVFFVVYFGTVDTNGFLSAGITLLIEPLISKLLTKFKWFSNLKN